MITILKRICFFVLTITIGYWIVILAISNIKYKKYPLIIYTSNYYPSKGGHTFQALSEYNPNKNYDLIFIGSSHAYRSFDPRIFDKYNISSFNLGTSGQSIESSYLILKNIIDKKNVKTILLEINRQELSGSSEANESSFDITLNAPTYKIGFDYLKTLFDWRFVNLLHYKYFTSWHTVVYKDTTYLERGFSLNQDTAKEVSFSFNEAKPVSKNKLNVLENIISLAQENNIQIILTSQPMPKNYSKSQHSELVKFLDPLLQKYSVNYYDYTFDIHFKTNEHFYDYGHLNQAGVEIYDSLLLNNKNFIYSINAK